MANSVAMLPLKLVSVLVLTWTCRASSQHVSGDDAAPCDYDSLMKVIERLERRVEVVEKLERRVEALEAENAEQRSEITELKAAVKQHDKDILQQERPAEENGDVDAKSDGNAAKQAPNRIRRASPELTIAFYAGVQTEVHHLGQGQNVPFDKVVTNVGNAYDGHIGVFRAPVAGVYVFSTTVLTYAHDSAHYAFALNGQPITTLYVNGVESGADADSQTIILQLKPGDDVSVQHTELDHGLYGGSHSVFSGFLLSRTDDEALGVVG